MLHFLLNSASNRDVALVPASSLSAVAPRRASLLSGDRAPRVSLPPLLELPEEAGNGQPPPGGLTLHKSPREPPAVGSAGHPDVLSFHRAATGGKLLKRSREAAAIKSVGAGRAACASAEPRGRPLPQ